MESTDNGAYLADPVGYPSNLMCIYPAAVLPRSASFPTTSHADQSAISSPPNTISSGDKVVDEGELARGCFDSRLHTFAVLVTRESDNSRVESDNFNGSKLYVFSDPYLDLLEYSL